VIWITDFNNETIKLLIIQYHEIELSPYNSILQNTTSSLWREKEKHVKTLATLTYLALLSALAFHPPLGQADEVQIDFENQTVQTTTQLVINTPNLTVTISRPGADFGIEDPLSGSFGLRSLSPGSNSAGAKFVADFSNPVNSVTFDIGDNVSDLDNLFVTAYSGPGATGDKLADAYTSCCGTSGPLTFGAGTVSFSSGTLTISAPGMKSIAFIGGSFSAPNSVFYDNFKVDFEKQVVDLDSDGVPDDVDYCKNSILTKTVVIDGCDTNSPNTLWQDSGCTMSDYIMACSTNAKNHGHFVKCVDEFSTSLEDYHYVTSDHKDDLQSCAAQASLPE
jgi:hypothetical protein